MPTGATSPRVKYTLGRDEAILHESDAILNERDRNTLDAGERSF